MAIPPATAGRSVRTSGILAPPASFSIDGKQYIAVLSGWGGDSRGDLKAGVPAVVESPIATIRTRAGCVASIAPSKSGTAARTTTANVLIRR